MSLGLYNSFLLCLLLHSQIRTPSGLGFSGPFLPFPHVAEGKLMGPVHTEAHTALETEAHSYQDTVAPLPEAGLRSGPVAPTYAMRDVHLCTSNLAVEHTHKVTLSF